MFTVPLLLILHDAYFYWVHRLLHHPRIFQRVHRIHHLSRTPTSWAAYSFSVGEAFAMTLFVPVAMALIPLHPYALFAFLAIMIVRNAMGHSGIEFHPIGWVDSPLDALTTVTLRIPAPMTGCPPAIHVSIGTTQIRHCGRAALSNCL